MGGGGVLGLNHAQMLCLSKSIGSGFFFGLQVNGINEMLSFKLGMEFASSVYIGENTLEALNVKGSGTEFQQVNVKIYTIITKG